MILAVWPLPQGPIKVTCAPRSRNTGSACRKSSGEPPAMMVNAPSRAAPGPPETGASTQRKPASAAAREPLDQRPKRPNIGGALAPLGKIGARVGEGEGGREIEADQIGRAHV